MTLADILGPTMEATGLPLLLGANHLGAHTKPPRIVWVPLSGRFEGAIQRAGAHGVLQEPMAFGVHCWGRSFDEALELRRRVVLALRRTLGPMQTAARLEGSEWLAREGTNLQLGEVYLLTVSLVLPLTDEQWCAVAPLSEEHAIPTAEVTNVAPAANPDASAGDGELDALEN